MKYALNVSAAVRATLTTLPLDMQEALWDLLEGIVDDASRRSSRVRVEGEAHRVVVRRVGTGEQLADAAFVVDHGTGTVHLMLVRFTELRD